MFQVAQGNQGFLDNVMAGGAAQRRHNCQAAGVLFILRAVEACPGMAAKRVNGEMACGWWESRAEVLVTTYKSFPLYERLMGDDAGPGVGKADLPQRCCLLLLSVLLCF